MRNAISLESVTTEPATAGNIPLVQNKLDVEHLLAQLPWAARQCLILNRILGYSKPEIASRLRLKQEQVAQLIESGIAMLSALQ